MVKNIVKINGRKLFPRVSVGGQSLILHFFLDAYSILAYFKSFFCKNLYVWFHQKSQLSQRRRPFGTIEIVQFLVHCVGVSSY